MNIPFSSTLYFLNREVLPISFLYLQQCHIDKMCEWQPTQMVVFFSEIVVFSFQKIWVRCFSLSHWNKIVFLPRVGKHFGWRVQRCPRWGIPWWGPRTADHSPLSNCVSCWSVLFTSVFIWGLSTCQHIFALEWFCYSDIFSLNYYKPALSSHLPESAQPAQLQHVSSLLSWSCPPYWMGCLC